MKFLISGISFFLALCNIVFAQNFDWAQKLGGGNYDEALCIQVDDSGNVYTAGLFLETADFNPGPAAFNLTSAGGTDIFVSKLNAQGQFLWAKRIGGIGSDEAYSLAIDSSGNICFTGKYNATVDFDPGPGLFLLSSSDVAQDFFVCKLKANGDFLWAKTMGGYGTEESKTVKIDRNGDIFLSGYFTGIAADFDPGPGTFLMSSASQGVSRDIFVLKLNSEGNFIWAKKIGGLDSDVANALEIDPDGNLVLTGYFQNYSGSTDFDPGPGVFNMSGGLSSIFLCKLSNDGNFIWAKSISGSFGVEGKALTSDSAGNIYSTGYFENKVDFNPGADTFNLVSTGAWGTKDIYILKLDSSGNFEWAKQIGGPEVDEGSTITIDRNKNVLIGGYFLRTMDFDPGPGAFNMAAGVYEDAFILKLSPGGDFIWARQLGGIVFCNSLAADKEDNVYATGRFSGTCDFDPGTGVFNLNSASSSHDVYISKLKPLITLAETITETSDCRIFPNPAWNGQFQVLSNQYSEFKVFDLSGKLIAEEMIQPGQTQSITLHPGMYIGKFISTDGVRSTKILAE
jgi:hypothetical protein